MMVEPRVVQIVGDGAEGHWLTWRWADPEWLAKECPDATRSRGTHRVTDPNGLSTKLSEALPASDLDLKLHGALTAPEREQDLMQALSDALIPQALRTQLLACHKVGASVHVRVMPSPPVAAVPWGLLPIDGPGLRLLDIADVSWIGPILPRDLSGEPGPRPPWQRARTLPPLHVLDPETSEGFVLSSDVALCACHGGSGPVAQGMPFSVKELTDRLRVGASRLLLVGHCIREGGDTAFLFSEPSAPDHLSARREISTRWGKGALFSADLLRGTTNSHSELEAGAALWPIPPRAGIVACASGTDFSVREPFGFATALLINGADTVHATLWTLPTDHALLGEDESAAGAFAGLVQAVDHAQSADDPVATICDWQRSCLDIWRAAPSLGTSPLLWGSVMTMTAPDRRLR